MFRKRYALLLGTIASTAVIALTALSLDPKRTQLLRDQLQGRKSNPDTLSQRTAENVPPEIQIKLLSNEIYVTDASGQLRQLTRDGKPKEHVEMSPGRDRVVYHTPFDPYKSESEPLILNVLDVETGSNIQRIPVRWSARFVTELKWIQEHLVIARGEGAFLAVINLNAWKQTHQLVGSDFSLSPDGAIIIYRHDFNPLYGSIPPASNTDHVLLSLIEREPPSGLAKTNYKVIYPDLYVWGEFERKSFKNLNDRHRIKSAFVWSPDSRMVTFAEVNQQRCRLIVLKLDVAKEDVVVSHKRFDLGTASIDVAALSWMPEGGLIKVSGDGMAWLIDVAAEKVQPLQ